MYRRISGQKKDEKTMIQGAQHLDRDEVLDMSMHSYWKVLKANEERYARQKRKRGDKKI
mgnify:CR=1 FL=1